MLNKFQSLGNAGRLIGFEIQIYISDFEILISANSRQHDASKIGTPLVNES